MRTVMESRVASTSSFRRTEQMEEAAVPVEELYAEIPTDWKALRACLRCSLIKSYTQFYENGCENCPFLRMTRRKDQIYSCTSAYFEGIISMLEPTGSWVARWQRIEDCIPGMYAIEVAGDLPNDMIEYCEDNNLPYRAHKGGKR